jgi:hypothetical protein
MRSNASLDVIVALIENGASSTRAQPCVLTTTQQPSRSCPIAPSIPKLVELELPLELPPKALHQRHRPRQLRRRGDGHRSKKIRVGFDPTRIFHLYFHAEVNGQMQQRDCVVTTV